MKKTGIPTQVFQYCILAASLILGCSCDIFAQNTGWRGTIKLERVYDAQHRLAAESYETKKEHHILTITVLEDGLAKLHLVYNATHVIHLASRCNGLFNDTTITETGQGSDTVGRDVGQPLIEGNTYKLGGYGPSIDVTKNVTENGPDPNGCSRMISESKTETVPRQCCGFAVENQSVPTMGSVLSGSVTELDKSDCGADSTCSGRTTITWKLARGKRLSIADAKLFDKNYLDKKEATAYGLLKALSASQHNYFNGNTQVYGTIILEGSPDDKMQTIELQVLESGKIVATGRLHGTAATDLLSKPFAPAGKIAITKPGHLFDIQSDQFGAVDQEQDGKLALIIKATSEFGDEATHELGQVTKLVRYTKANRYGMGRDEREGGDDWVLPSVKGILEHLTKEYPKMGLSWGDMSNMNGGKFPGHKSHEQGLDVDGYLADYSTKGSPIFFTRPGKKFGDADYEVLITAAIGLVNLLNDPKYGSEIQMMGVTYYDELFGDKFARAISRVRLSDGRMARDVIRPWVDHDTHFHLRFKTTP